MVRQMNIDLFDKIPGQPIRQWAYYLLRTNIIRLHLPPGSAVSESEIAKALGISRTPAREAFIRLVEDGLMEVVAQKGSLISLIDIDQAEDARFVRTVIEQAVIKEACSAFSDKDMFELNANLKTQELCKEKKNYERMFSLDNDFHRIIYRAVNKERIWDQIKKLAYNLDRLRVLRLSSPFPWDDIISEHHQISKLLIEKKPERVGEVISRHLTRTIFNKLAKQNPSYFKQNIHEYVSQLKES